MKGTGTWATADARQVRSSSDMRVPGNGSPWIRDEEGADWTGRVPGDGQKGRAQHQEQVGRRACCRGRHRN
ncbi:hypothetical protein EV2_033875 [Malus domestica]